MNQENNLRLLAKISLIVFAYILIYFFYNGFLVKIYEGDSLNYHIPIAKAFLNGTIINPVHINGNSFLRYYPGSSEGILAALILIGLPMSIFNVLAAIFLFIVLIYSGKKFELNNYLSIIFASSIVTLHTIIRWINTQVIDSWIVAFFMLTLALLQKPEKKISYFLLLGLSSGMLIGTKYTGLIYLIVLLIFHFQKLIKVLNLKQLLYFLIPFTILGLIWYFRNLIVINNPLYPFPFLFFKGVHMDFQSNNVLRAFFYPDGIVRFLNGALSEYGLWIISLFAPLLFLFKKFRHDKNLSKARMLIFIAIINFGVFLFLPSDKYYHIVVSVFRYSYPVFVLVILSFFVIAQKLKKDLLIAFLALTGLIIIPEIRLLPKLMFIFIPVAIGIFYFEEIYSFMKNKVRLKGGK